MSCLVLSCLVLSCLVLSWLGLACLGLSCLVLACLVLACLGLSCLVLACLFLSYLILSCLVFSCLGLSCLLFSSLLYSTLLYSSLLLSLSFCLGLRLCLCLCLYFLVLALPLWCVSCRVSCLFLEHIYIILSTSNSLCFNIQDKNKTHVCLLRLCVVFSQGMGIAIEKRVATLNDQGHDGIQPPGLPGFLILSLPLFLCLSFFLWWVRVRVRVGVMVGVNHCFSSRLSFVTLWLKPRTMRCCLFCLCLKGYDTSSPNSLPSSLTLTLTVCSSSSIRDITQCHRRAPVFSR